MKVRTVYTNFYHEDFSQMMKGFNLAAKDMVCPKVTSCEDKSVFYVYETDGLDADDLEVLQEFFHVPTALHAEYSGASCYESLDNLVAIGLLKLVSSDEDDVGEYRLNVL